MTVRKLSQKLQIVLYKHTRCPTFSLLGSARRVCINESCLEMSPAHFPRAGVAHGDGSHEGPCFSFSALPAVMQRFDHILQMMVKPFA